MIDATQQHSVRGRPFEGTAIRASDAAPLAARLAVALFLSIFVGAAPAAAAPVLTVGATFSQFARAYNESTTTTLRDTQYEFLSPLPVAFSDTVGVVADTGPSTASVSGTVGVDLSGSVSGSASHDLTLGNDAVSGAQSGFSLQFHVSTPSILIVDGTIRRSNVNSRVGISLDRFLNPGFDPVFNDGVLLPAGIEHQIARQVLLDVDQDYVLRVDLALGPAREMFIFGDWSMDFSVVPVPEPTVALLLGMGLVALSRRR